MNTYNIWAEPYLATGMEGIPSQPILVAKDIQAESFKEACDVIGNDPEYVKRFGNYRSETPSFWGCKLHPTRSEAEAPWAELRERNRNN